MIGGCNTGVGGNSAVGGGSNRGESTGGGGVFSLKEPPFTP